MISTVNMHLAILHCRTLCPGEQSKSNEAQACDQENIQRELREETHYSFYQIDKLGHKSGIDHGFASCNDTAHIFLLSGARVITSDYKRLNLIHFTLKRGGGA